MSGVPERIQQVQSALAAGGVVSSQKVTLYHTKVHGQPITFCGTMWRDPVQRTHRKGMFYEQDELELLAGLVGTGKTIVDIGANIGNHTLFFAKMMQAAKVVPFEPNPLAYEVLLAHVLVNGVADRVDLSHIGLGLSDKSAEGFGMEERDRNLGAASMIEEGGDISLIRADAALGDLAPDFIKVDVEGMEIGVLKGLGDIPARTKCLMYIEVNNENADAFAEWRDGQGLVTIHEIKRYRTSMYHLVIHKDRADEMTNKLNALLKEKNDAEN